MDDVGLPRQSPEEDAEELRCMRSLCLRAAVVFDGGLALDEAEAKLAEEEREEDWVVVVEIEEDELSEACKRKKLLNYSCRKL